MIQRILLALKSAYAKDFINFSFGYFICALLALATTATINKKLNQHDLGEFSYIKSLFELLVAIFSLGIYSAYLRFNIDGDNIKLKKIVQRYILIAAIILLVVFYTLSQELLVSIYCVVLFYNERTYYYRSLLKTNKLNLLKILSGVVTLLTIGLFSAFSILDLNSSTILFCYSLGYILSFLFYTSSDKVTVNVESIPVSTILKYCIPGALLVIVNWVFIFVSQTIIKERYGFSGLAPYAIAQRALLSVNLITSLYLMFYPTVYFKEIEKNYQFIRKLRLLIILSLIAYIILCTVFSKEIYILMGAKEYVEDINYFKVLLISELFKVLASLYGLYLTYKIKTFYTLVVLTIGSVFNVLLIYYFIEEYGAITACYSSILSYAAVFIVMLIFSLRGERQYLKKDV